ncbi:MAG TPA: DUF3667 domain-containing protein [Gemmatimonadaceae bacterium]
MTGTTRTSPRTADASIAMRPPEASTPGVCLNCGEPVAQRYCPACGQAVVDPNPTLGEFAHEAASEFLHWDGKLAATFRLLFATPGELTREYLAGRRARYLSPLRLYLTCSVLFFALKALTPEPPIVVRAGPSHAGMVTIQEDTVGATLEAIDKMTQSKSAGDRVAGRALGNALRHGDQTAASMSQSIPNVMFVLVPIFAGLVALVFRGRRMRYPQHLAFALHTHAFLFLALVLTLAPRVTRNAALDAIAVAVSFLAIAVYMVLAVRRVYGGSTWNAILRSSAVAATYFAAFTVAMLLTFAIVALRV